MTSVLPIYDSVNSPFYSMVQSNNMKISLYANSELVLDNDVREDDVQEDNVLEDDVQEDDVLEDGVQEDIDIKKTEILASINSFIGRDLKQSLIQKISELAIINRCILLSQNDPKLSGKLKWQCQCGHNWERRYSKQIVTKEWCKVCAKNKRQVTLMAKIRDYVQSKNGKCITTTCASVRDRVQLLCKNNHTWETTVDTLIRQKTWCSTCSGRDLLTIEDCKKLALARLGECLSETYINIDSKLLWKCYFGHTWTTTMNLVKNQHTWCPLCKIRLGEEITRKLFETLFNEKFERVRLEIMNGLELDGYCENLKLAFEYDGSQHHKFEKLFHKTEDDFEKQKLRDIRKTLLCQQNNITLIRIPYSVKYKDLQDFITTECAKNNIAILNNSKIDHTKFVDLYRLKAREYKDYKLKLGVAQDS